MQVEAAIPLEYAAARDGAVLLPLSGRDVLAATGPQRQKFLHGILSNAILDLSPGRGCLAGLMDVKGHLIVLLRALVTNDAVLLEMPKDRRSRVLETLLFYRVAAPVRFTELDTAVLAVMGPAAATAFGKLGLACSQLAPSAHIEGVIRGSPVRIAAAPDLPAAAFVLHTTPGGGAAVTSALADAGVLPISQETLDVLRIEDGRPLYGQDVTEENLLHETGLLLEYHSPSKGCYVGQEVVARLEARGGNVSKKLRGLKLTVATSPGTVVESDGREVGRITTAAVSPKRGPIAMAYIHRSAFAPGTEVLLHGATASVVELPFRG